MNDFTLKALADDPDACRIVCDKCKANGDAMSRNWNYDAAADCWEPQVRHLPPCKHFANERETANGVVARFTGLVPRAM